MTDLFLRLLGLLASSIVDGESKALLLLLVEDKLEQKSHSEVNWRMNTEQTTICLILTIICACMSTFMQKVNYLAAYSTVNFG